MAQEYKSAELFPTLDDAREWLKSAVSDPGGAICPCCDRFDKMYSRKITVGAITDLLRLYRHSMQSYALNLEGSGYHHYSDFIQTLHIHGDFAKLVCIGLVERGSNHDPAKKDSGMYKITAKGVAFVCDGGTVPERLFLYHNELTGVSLETKRVTDFYPQFNYEQLMAEGVI